MKKALILIIIFSACLSSCQKTCYRFTVVSRTTTYNNFNNQTQTSYITYCDMTARQARKTAEGLNSKVTTGSGKYLVTVTTTCTYQYQ